MEERFLNSFIKKGYKKLNISKTGSLGGVQIIWSKEKVIKISKKYSDRTVWRKKEPEAYNASLRLNIKDEVTAHMTKKYEFKWDKKTVIENAKKYKIKKEWRRKNPGAYTAAQNLGIYKLATQHMKVISPRGKWTEENITKRSNYDKLYRTCTNKNVAERDNQYPSKVLY